MVRRSADVQDARQGDGLRIWGRGFQEGELRGALVELGDRQVQHFVLGGAVQQGDEPHLDVQRGPVFVLDNVEDLQVDAEGHRVVACYHYRR